MTDEQRDAHLREALRHAPDAQVQPPPALSELILKEARAKARDASAPARAPRHPLLGMWDWLARPAVATGFAGVMVATLVGLMWWDQPMDEALPRRPAPAAAPAPMTAAPPVAATAPAPAPPPTPAQVAEPERAAPARPALRKSTPAADKLERTPPAAVVAAHAPTPAAEAKAEPAQAAREAVASAAPTMADTATAGAGALASAKSAEESKRLRSLTPPPAPAAAPAPRAELSEMRQGNLAAAPQPTLASLRASIAAEPARWAWRRGDGTVNEMNDALYAWLAQLDSTTGRAWQPSAALEAAAPRGRALRLHRDGRLLHSLQLTERSVLWQHGQSSWHIELPPAQLDTLQTALDAAAP